MATIPYPGQTTTQGGNPSSIPANPTGFNSPAFGPSNVTIPGAGSAATNPSIPGFTSSLNAGDVGALTGTYGNAIGDTLYNFLASGAGYNPQIISQLLQQFQPQIAQGQANIETQYGAAGAADSSVAGQALGAFNASIAGQEDTLIANLYQSSLNNYINMLTGVSGINAGVNVGSNQGGLLNDINSILGLSSTAAGGINAASTTAGEGGSTIESILAGLGGL